MRLLVAIFCVFVLSLGTAYASLQQWWTQPFVGQQRMILQVDAGSSLTAVANRLEQGGSLRYPWLWSQLARFTGKATQIKKGEYLITASQSPRHILQRLVEGDVVSYSVTLPEGITLQQGIALLHAQSQLSATLTGADDPRLLELVKPQLATEGMFFPDTYQFVKGDSDLSILTRAHSRMKAVVNEEWAARAEALPINSPYEAVILASIVEKETGLASERPTIAGVFTRRLNKGMRLQTDPTVIYGLGPEFDGNLKRIHLKDASNAFNSYRHSGLPPTPISLVGRAALNAALNPEDGSSLYFVARGDGSHVFSATLEEHEKAVRQYQLQRRSDYRSSPPPQS